MLFVLVCTCRWALPQCHSSSSVELHHGHIESPVPAPGGLHHIAATSQSKRISIREELGYLIKICYPMQPLTDIFYDCVKHYSMSNVEMIMDSFQHCWRLLGPNLCVSKIQNLRRRFSTPSVNGNPLATAGSGSISSVLFSWYKATILSTHPTFPIRMISYKKD